MALVRTTLSVALAATDLNAVVASATSIAAGRYIRVDDEVMQVATSYVSGTTIPLVRGVNGTKTVAHVITSGFVHGAATDFALPAAQGPMVTYQQQHARVVQSLTGATNTLTLPPAGTDLVVVLNGTTADTLTIPVPTVDMDGNLLWIVSNGVAQHILTFTGGLSGAGTSYDQITINATAPAAFGFIACNALWYSVAGAAIGGTTTNISGVIG